MTDHTGDLAVSSRLDKPADSSHRTSQSLRVKRESARLASKSPLEHEMTRLKAMHRSNYRYARGYGGSLAHPDHLAECRMVRRWMRIVRRGLARERMIMTQRGRK